eukprot:CAMPEP_0170607496 /NCGR_PEP_ID=MMETSP0224-20130122/21086_1 /TAXON_ID=285029 /ORGANISM="Togula jolla, Strain CCCM 725" /LENGTH=210 /DNA_ID=CAMNT_0010932667 /DNA_START=93 /DNA_END=725 /DNA_ORIENTATION=-
MSTKEQSRTIIRFARQGKLEGDGALRALVNEAVKMQLDLDYSEKPYFRSALWEATWKNHEAIVKLLVDKGASVTFADYQGRTPLHEAAYYGHATLVEYFLEKGHPIDLADNFGQTALFRAVDGGRHDVVEILIKRKASTNQLDGDDVTAQHLAAFKGMPSMSEWLLFHGAYRNRFAVDEASRAPEDSKSSMALSPRPVNSEDGEAAADAG